MRPYLGSSDGQRGPTRVSLELARNAAGVLVLEPDVDACALLVGMIRHRLANRWIVCGDVQSCAKLGAWLRFGGSFRVGRIAA
jgi:hypothetical protein